MYIITKQKYFGLDASKILGVFKMEPHKRQINECNMMCLYYVFARTHEFYILLIWDV